ncbi:hypothetical protein [Schlesneria sp. DSM 10557]|uniref:hypothetical protein n=1 Tax=Schlesneria sp. DSM 10557 TaxID=3044399 RepID=UPI0035A01ED2
MFVFDDAEPKTVDVEITLKGGSFTLILTPPNLEARTVDDAQSYEHYFSQGVQNTEAFKARFFARLNAVTGWRGVHDARGEPVEFNQARLRALLGKWSAVTEQLSPHLAALFLPQEKSVGESGASPSDSPTATHHDTAPPSTPTSAAGDCGV